MKTILTIAGIGVVGALAYAARSISTGESGAGDSGARSGDASSVDAGAAYGDAASDYSTPVTGGDDNAPSSSDLSTNDPAQVAAAMAGDTASVDVSYSDSYAIVPGGISNDPATWPTGNKIWDLARAIAIAEGYNHADSAPYKLNNPGDISDGLITYSGEFHGGSTVTRFPDAQTGWQWLYAKLERIKMGMSHRYSADDSFAELAHTWAGNDVNWRHNVVRELNSFGYNVDVNTTLREYFG